MDTSGNGRPLGLVGEWVKFASNRKSKQLEEPGRQLNSAQKAMRLICVEAFDHNMSAMGRAIDKTQPAIRKFIIKGETSPKFDELQHWASMVGVTAEALIGWVSGDIFVAGEWFSEDDPEFQTKATQAIAYISTKKLEVEGERDPAEVLDGDD